MLGQFRDMEEAAALANVFTELDVLHGDDPLEMHGDIVQTAVHRSTPQAPTHWNSQRCPLFALIYIYIYMYIYIYIYIYLFYMCADIGSSKVPRLGFLD